MLAPCCGSRRGRRKLRHDRDNTAAAWRRLFAAALAATCGHWRHLAGRRCLPVYRCAGRQACFSARGVRHAGAARMPGGLQPRQQRPVARPEAATHPGGRPGCGGGPDPVAMGPGQHRHCAGAHHRVRDRWGDPHGDGLARPLSGLAAHHAGRCPARAAGRHRRVPWQPGYVDAIPYCIGVGLAASGAGTDCGRGWACGSGLAAAPSPRTSSMRAPAGPACNCRPCRRRRPAASR